MSTCLRQRRNSRRRFFSEFGMSARRPLNDFCLELFREKGYGLLQLLSVVYSALSPIWLMHFAPQQCLAVDIPPQVNHGVAVILKQYLYNILAEVMYIALYCGKHYLAPAYGGRVVGRKPDLDSLKSRLRGRCRPNELRQKQNACVKVLPHLVQSGYYVFIDNIHGFIGLQKPCGKSGGVVFKPLFNRAAKTFGLYTGVLAGAGKRLSDILYKIRDLSEFNKHMESRTAPLGAGWGL